VATEDEPATSEPVPVPGFTAEQREALRAGQTVEHAMSFSRFGRDYVGGVSYLLVRAEPRRVFEVLNSLPNLTQVLPSTRRSEVIDRQERGVRVEIEMGNNLVSTTYTVFFALEQADEQAEAHTVRFWLDPSRPHSIDDVWGFFRATRFDSQHALVAVGAAVDLGSGLLRVLLQSRIQRTILRMPTRIRDRVENPAGAALSRVAAQQQTSLAEPEPPPREPALR
jgi:ribosome-associated toxin RatA of RatAB toxin-antitoxin module